ncbi:MAG: M14 family metallopeptidase [Candidatus Zixiibacteriota bacterium]
MKRVIRYASILALVALCLSVSTAFAQKPVLTFDHLYNNDQIVDALRLLNKAYPNLTTLESIGKTEENRDIWLFTINNPKTGKDTDKPGIYVDGTIHGNEVQATEVCLYLAYYLLNSYGEIENITKLVDNKAFYIIPIVNVDNRARFFTDPADYNYRRSAVVPFDDDHDGLADEDDIDDLDGDNEILEMRIRDPFGEYKTNPDDPRMMIRVKPGEKGEWRRLGEEGIDNDGDGQLNEDGPGYLDMNRNYGFKWQPPYVQGGAGEYPMSAKVPHAIANFVITKPNICFDFAFHNSGRLWVRGPGSKLAGMYSPQDVRVYDYLGEEAEKITPGYRYIIGSRDMYTTHGDFDEFMYSTLGIYGFVGELYSSIKETYRPYGEKEERDQQASYWGDSPEEERLKFNDRLMQGQMFKEWAKFNHPQFGEIEIGGWRKFTTRIPQPFMLNELVHRNASVVIFTASQTPEVSLELIDVKDLGNGLKRVRVRATNPNAMPSLSSKIMRENIIRKDIFKIEGVEVVSGGIIDDIPMERIEFVEHRPWMIFTNVPSFDKRDIQWIVRGSGTATVTYDGLKAINQTMKIKL